MHPYTRSLRACFERGVSYEEGIDAEPGSAGFIHCQFLPTFWKWGFPLLCIRHTSDCVFMSKTWMVGHGLACGQYPVCVSWSHHRHFIKPRILQPRVSLSRYHQHGLWGSKTNVTPNSKTRILLLAQLVIQSRWLFFFPSLSFLVKLVSQRGLVRLKWDRWYKTK